MFLLSKPFPFKLFLVPLALWLALPAAARPAPKPLPKSPPARAEIQAIYNKINAAAAAKDVDAVFAYDSDDYTQIDKKGRVHDASDDRQGLEKLMEEANSIQAVTAIRGFSGTETEATVTVTDRVVIRIANESTGRAVTLRTGDTAREHWVKTADGWRRTRSRLLSDKVSLKKNF